MVMVGYSDAPGGGGKVGVGVAEDYGRWRDWGVGVWTGVDASTVALGGE